MPRNKGIYRKNRPSSLIFTTGVTDETSDDADKDLYTTTSGITHAKITGNADDDLWLCGGFWSPIYHDLYYLNDLGHN